MTDIASRQFMNRALQLAALPLPHPHPNPRVGCVIVRDGEIIGEGAHARAGEPHAEVHALAQAGERARGAAAYVTLEPCSHTGQTPPCAEALIEAGISEVWMAMEDPNPVVSGRGRDRLEQAGIRCHVGLLAEQAQQLNRGFIRRMGSGMPWLTCKLAVSLDGRTALGSGDSKWITSEAARADVHRGRAGASAILTGIGTVLRDDPALTVRLPDGDPQRQPLRVVLDSGLRLPEKARLLREPGETVILHCQGEEDSKAARLNDQERVTAVALGAREDGHPDLTEALAWLARERQVNEIWTEAGATLCGALLRFGLVDELLIYMAPKLLGDDGPGMFRLPGVETMDRAPVLEILDIRRVGGDWRIRARPGTAGRS